MDGLTNAENIGLLVRNCAAFGVHALIVGETCSSPYLRRAVRNSMGTIFKLHHLELRGYEEGAASHAPRPRLSPNLRSACPARPTLRRLHPTPYDKKTLAEADSTRRLLRGLRR